MWWSPHQDASLQAGGMLAGIGLVVSHAGIGLAVMRSEPILNPDPPKLRGMSVNPDHQTNACDAEEMHVIGRVACSAGRR